MSRECDDVGRSAIGSQYRSVFTAPYREASRLVDANNHAKVSDVNRSVDWISLLTGGSETVRSVNKFLSFVDGMPRHLPESPRARDRAHCRRS